MRAICLLFFLAIALADESCLPFGTRLALGNQHPSKEQDQLVIRFNTKKLCSRSYVEIKRSSQTFEKVECTSNSISYSNYTTYVHRCLLSELKSGQKFQYMVYGWSGDSSEDPQPMKNNTFISRFPFFTNPTQPLNCVVVADWSYIKEKSYDPLNNAMDYLLSLTIEGNTKQIDLIIINGDIAYDLDSNQGENYEDFLIMLSQVSVYWPVIISTGNHEWNSIDDINLFSGSFQLYGLVQNNITSLDLGLFNLIIFDPFSILYQGATDSQILNKFKLQLDKIALRNKPIIAMSHYPLACSSSANFCVNDRNYLIKFFQQMINHHVVLYIGAHYHVYERLYPYNGYTFIKEESPYKFTADKKYLISLVEGIAGNDKSIVQKEKKIQDFTAGISYNQTGYGVMRVDKTTVTYEHYLSKNPIQPIDDLVIDFGPQSNLRIQ